MHTLKIYHDLSQEKEKGSGERKRLGSRGEGEDRKRDTIVISLFEKETSSAMSCERSREPGVARVESQGFFRWKEAIAKTSSSLAGERSSSASSD